MTHRPRTRRRRAWRADIRSSGKLSRTTPDGASGGARPSHTSAAPLSSNARGGSKGRSQARAITSWLVRAGRDDGRPSVSDLVAVERDTSGSEIGGLHILRRHELELVHPRPDGMAARLVDPTFP